jgi:hypothetical protein
LGPWPCDIGSDYITAYDIDNLDVNLYLQGPICVYETDVHNHAQEDDMIREEAFRSHVKHGVRGDPCRPVKRSYDAAVSDLRRQERGRPRQRQAVVEFHTLRSSLARAKSEGVPKIPHRVRDVNIVNPWDETWSDERYLLHCDNSWGLLFLPQMKI